jgi:hypothetical protein
VFWFSSHRWTTICCKVGLGHPPSTKVDHNWSLGVPNFHRTHLAEMIRIHQPRNCGDFSRRFSVS